MLISPHCFTKKSKIWVSHVLVCSLSKFLIPGLRCMCTNMQIRIKHVWEVRRKKEMEREDCCWERGRGFAVRKKEVKKRKEETLNTISHVVLNWDQVKHLYFSLIVKFLSCIKCTHIWNMGLLYTHTDVAEKQIKHCKEHFPAVLGENWWRWGIFRNICHRYIGSITFFLNKLSQAHAACFGH